MMKHLFVFGCGVTCVLSTYRIFRECRLAASELARLKGMENEGRRLWEFSEKLLAEKGH